MQPLFWESFSFAPGLNTHHAWTEAGDILARDMQNLRADENAYLRLRQSTGERADARPTGRVVGIAATDTHYFYLQDNGVMYAVRLSDGERAVVAGVGGLEDRIYFIDEWYDFIVGKSEGQEKGFWIDLTEDVFTKRSLGLEPPSIAGINATYFNRAAPGLTTGFVYAYRFTYARVQGDEVDLLRRGAVEPSQSPLLMEGMESDLSEPALFYAGLDTGLTFREFRDKDDNVLAAPLDTGAGFNVIEFTNLTHSVEAQANAIFLYQSQGVEFGGTPLNVDNLEYRLVDVVLRESAEQALSTALRGATESWANQPLARFDNQRLPAEPAQITYFNDLVFAAVGDELRYSDVRDGAPVQWAFPDANSIVANGEIVFCVEHRGVLLFGGPQGIWRFTGTDEFNFVRDRVSGVGPVSGTAWVELEQGIAFIGRGGLYLTDGVSIQKQSTVMLDGFFENNPAVDGAVALLPDNDVLFSVRFTSGARFQFFQSARGGYFRWLGANAVQFATLDDGGVLFADSTSMAVRTLDFTGAVDADMAWFWFSQVIDFKEQGYGEALKVFKWLEVSSGHSGSGTLQVIVDGVSEAAVREFSFRGDAQRPVRIPILRRGERIQFRVSGVGDCNIRYLRLRADTRTARSRF